MPPSLVSKRSKQIVALLKNFPFIIEGLLSEGKWTVMELGISSRGGKKEIKPSIKKICIKKVTSCIEINTCKSISPFNYINVYQARMRISDPFFKTIFSF
eukprot:TRINITY_DN10912_c0_g2_i2.p1 TRINITY_DN10912_c0_g2~~TRINITY_DN10912_c0_g2_i2.p1  ORF type:complete len:100 (-),score=1.75 TRINITY_DN10912_c0_g2_i2:435-734(-)